MTSFLVLAHMFPYQKIGNTSYKMGPTIILGHLVVCCPLTVNSFADASLRPCILRYGASLFDSKLTSFYHYCF